MWHNMAQLVMNVCMERDQQVEREGGKGRANAQFVTISKENVRNKQRLA